MKAEVNKTVEVVLRMTEAEAKALRELAECVFTICDADERLGVHRQPIANLLPFGFDEELRGAVDRALRSLA